MNGRLVYSFDNREPAKQERAQALIADALQSGSAIISYQVIQEFLNVAQHKFAQALSAPDCRRFLTEVLTPLCEVFPDTLIVAAAVRGGMP